MRVNFIGLFNKPGYVGEISDETHLARELEKLGVEVNRVQRDIWKAYVDKEVPNIDWNLPQSALVNIVAKWPGFDDRKYIDELRRVSGAPVFYWVWDFMWDMGFPQWHLNIAKAADLYLSGEAGIFRNYIEMGIKPYYFQMDCCDGDIPVVTPGSYYDVIFTGSYLHQGNRVKFLKEITQEIPVHIFAWNKKEWENDGFVNVHEAIYGEDYNALIADSKITLGMSVEPNCWGYWSNRVGKVICAGGFLLQEYAPGMEQFLPPCVDYFNSPSEAVIKIKQYLDHEDRIRKKKQIASAFHYNFSSANKMRLMVELIDRYTKSDNRRWNVLP